MGQVLVVDDDRPIRELLRVILELEGHEVVVAEDGISALRMLTQASTPWAVLMDISMPYLTGIEVCHRLQVGGVPGVRHEIALMSAGMVEESECVPPARALLRKPFDVDRAVELVERLWHAVQSSSAIATALPAAVAQPPLAVAS